MGLLEIWTAILQRLHRVLTGGTEADGVRDDARAFGLAFLVACVAFGFELTNPTLGVDDYLRLGKDFRWEEYWIGRGMWGGLLLHYLTPGGWIVPFVTLLVGIWCQLISAVMLGWLLGAGRLGVVGRVAVYSLFVTFPYFAAQMAFSYLQIVNPLATLLCVFGLLAAVRQPSSLRRLALSAALIASGVSIYQGAISVLLAAAVADALVRFPGSASGNLRGWLQRCARIGGASVGGAVLYVLTHRLVLGLSGVSAPNRYYSVSFQPDFWRRWESISTQMISLVEGAGGLIPGAALGLFVGACLVLTVDYVSRRGSVTDAAVHAALLAGLVVAPFGVLFVHEGGLAPRGSLGVAVLWVVVFGALAKARSSLARTAGIWSCWLVVVIFAFQGNRLFYGQHLVQQADRMMMTRIAERIDQLGPGRTGEPRGVVPVGSYSHPEYAAIPRHPGSPLGFSNFEWDRGSFRRMRALAASIGVDRYVWKPPDSLGPPGVIRRLVSTRAPWPSIDSVFVHGDTVVVWLGGRPNLFDPEQLKAGLEIIKPRVVNMTPALAPITLRPTHRYFMHPGEDKNASIEIDTKGLSALELSPMIGDLSGAKDCATPESGIVEFTWALDGRNPERVVVDRNYRSTIPVDIDAASVLRIEVSKGNGTPRCDWFSVGFLEVETR